MINPGFMTISKLGCLPIPLNDGSGLDIIVPKEELSRQIQVAGNQLRFDYQNLDMTTIQVLEGGAWIHGQTASRLPEASRHSSLSIVAKRYGAGEIGGEVKVYCDWIREFPSERAKITGRHCLIFDDVLDKGDTIAEVIKVVQEFNPASIKTFFMVRKDVKRKVDVPADYVLFDIDNVWLIGAGLDDNGMGRDRPHIACRPKNNS